jgi:hypothetical protein
MIFRAAIFLVSLASAFVVGVGGQGKVPKFADFPTKVEKRSTIRVNLSSHRTARMFRTNLREAAKGGVNFAGHFVVATWGCGTNCSDTGIIDARTGKVYFTRELQGAGFGFCDLPDETEPLVYKADSRLFILSGFKGGELEKKDSRCGVYYLEWTGSVFRQVRFVQKKRLDIP